MAATLVGPLCACLGDVQKTLYRLLDPPEWDAPVRERELVAA